METETILGEMKKTFGNVLAACLYGSQVCGYATGESDHDALVILEEYAPGVRYTYVESGIEIAFLAVSKRVFEDDAAAGAYGGFIADRVINPFEPLVNEGYLQDWEVERKKSIVEWETTKLVVKNKEDARYINVNILYFPFKKWNRISAVYRPYLYSIENTLRKDLREQNLRQLTPGYKRAIDESGLLHETLPGWYRIDEAFIEETLGSGLPARLERIKMAEREIEGVVARYLTHERAGGSDRDLIIKEVMSKVRREARHIKEQGFSRKLKNSGDFLIPP